MKKVVQMKYLFTSLSLPYNFPILETDSHLSKPKATDLRYDQTNEKKHGTTIIFFLECCAFIRKLLGCASITSYNNSVLINHI